MRVLFALWLVVLSGCAIQNDLSYTDRADVGAVVPIYVGTTRNPTNDGTFNSSLADATNYVRYDVSIPPLHEPGKIEWPLGKTPNPEKNFAVTAKYTYADDTAFKASLRKQIIEKSPVKKRVYVYVHGFYNTFGDGLYRAAQISNDFSVNAVVTHFAWPSTGSAFGYAHDRDAVLTARDSFQEFLETVKDAGASEIVIVAHSLGAALTMETLRSIAIEDEGAVTRMIKGVALIAPDLDVDLFVSQASRIGKLPDFFVIFTSSRDRALQLSARVSGETARLGNIQDVTPIAHLETVVWDISALDGIQKSNHLAAFENPEALEFIQLIQGREAVLSVSGKTLPGPFPSVAISINNLTRIVLSPESANN
ncbi:MULTISPECIES: alpha/beta hydrolase [Falsihalocynthiibacter]|uniref:Esterase n=1 Tax=Falsihalocynthiibacter arcticus TaxID=1579316 RepID=A0A126UXR3_9RHOB|nr:alpha/beta fold hydrolase [Falsihalocynthiibacter arcticus]AML50858.1 hypothetical protein RC74_05800 [Falsihalocynthiibacter arcticus]